MLRDAATAMLVREGAEGLEVCLLRRSPDMVFVGGAHVFPGGAVDPADARAVGHSAAARLDDLSASAVLGLQQGGLAFWVAAVRETFEEAGVLLADGPAAGMAEVRAQRTDVAAGRVDLLDACAAAGLVLALDRLHYVSHWITPEGAPRRYDTRFFVTAAPPGQEPVHDDNEVVATVWSTPRRALERCGSGEWDLILPTIRNLELLARFDRAGDALDALAGAGDPERARLALGEPGGISRVRLDDDPATGGEPVAGAVPGGAP